MKLVSMSHAFGGNTTLTTLYINYETGLGKRQRGNDKHNGNPTSSHGKPKKGMWEAWLHLAAKPQSLVAHLLMHMGGGRERRPQRHRRGFRVG